MDPNLLIPWSKRIRYLRWACRYTYSGFSKILGFSQSSVKRIEHGERPTLRQIRRIRTLERIFKVQLDDFKRRIRKYGSIRHAKFEREEEVYVPYAGCLTRKVIHYYSRPVVPDRKEDIEALGGMETVNSVARVQGKRKAGAQIHYRRESPERIKERMQSLRNKRRAKRGSGEAQGDDTQAVKDGSQLVEDREE